MDPVSLTLSVAALVVSIVSAVAASVISRRQNALQERMLAFETAREESRLKQARSADVKAAVMKSGRQFKLFVVNEGPIAAKNLRILLDGKPLLEHRLILRGEDEITMLGPV